MFGLRLLMFVIRLPILVDDFGTFVDVWATLLLVIRLPILLDVCGTFAYARGTFVDACL